MLSSRRAIRIGLAACAAGAVMLACSEPDTVTSSEPAPPPVAKAPAEPEPPAAPQPPTAPTPAPAPAPAPAPGPPQPAEEPAAPPAQPAISLEELGQRIKETPAIGAFSKLSLKNDLDDLVDGLRSYHAHKQGDLENLHQRYEALVLKLMTLLEKDEPELALALGRSRERIWTRLVDPAEFAKLST
jgi:type IV secretory pathway VirB10-like protein